MLRDKNPLLELVLEKSINQQDFITEQITRLKLGEDVKKVYKNLENQIYKDSVLCLKVLKNNILHKEKRLYYDLIMHADKYRWNFICKLCEQEIEKSKQIDKLNTMIKERVEIKQPYIKYTDVIRTLDTILYDDQYYRKILVYKEDSLKWKLQTENDKNNYIKIEKIINEHGFLSFEDVGFYHANTIWLVLHHQNDCEIRNKYLKDIEQLVELNKLSQGEFRLFTERTNSLCKM